jgi:hypothetical protein
VPKHQQKNRWSADVTEHSDALDLEQRVFEKKSAAEIAKSLKRSAESSDRRKSSPFRSAMSMLTIYINRRRAKSASRAEAHPGSGEREIARAVWTRSLNGF